LTFAEKERSAADRDHVSFPLSNSPIVRLFNQLGTARASEAQVRIRASSELVASTMSKPYVRFLGDAAYKLSVVGSPGVPLVRLVLAATGAQLIKDEDLRVQAATEFLYVAKGALSRGPDGTLFAEASRVGEDALAVARISDCHENLSAVLFELGTMYLDPYTAGIDFLLNPVTGQVSEFDKKIERWLRSEGKPPPGGARMPPAAEALNRAVDLLGECCSVAEGRRRGFAQKALAEALLFRGGIGDPLDVAEVGRLVARALDDLDPERDHHDVVMLLKSQASLSGQSPVIIGPAFFGSIGELEHRRGANLAAQLVLADVERLRSSEPDAALLLLREAGPLLRKGRERDRTAGLIAEMQALVTVFDVEPRTLGSQSALLSARVSRMLQRAERERWTSIRQGAALIALAMVSTQNNKESEGLQLLDQALSIAPTLAMDHSDCLNYLRATLLIGVGVNSANNASWRAANDNYSAALDEAMQLGLDEMTYDLLVRIAHGVHVGGVVASLSLERQLFLRASRIEAHLGARATDLLQEAYRQAIAGFIDNHVPVNSLIALLQLAKGHRFASVVSSGDRYRPFQDWDSRWMLGAIGRAQSQLVTKDMSPHRSAEDMMAEDVLVATYSDVPVNEEPDPDPDHSTAGEAAHFAELRRRYDAYLSEQLLLGAGPAMPLLTVADLQAALDPRTVLLDLYIGRGPNKDMAVYLMTVTQESVDIEVIPQGVPDGEKDVLGDAAQLRISALGEQVAALRRTIQEPPLGHRQVGPVATQWLEYLAQRLLGPVGANLESHLDAGKDHLCIVPHGPLHYLPFQLLGPPERPIAEAWTVTYLPNLRLITDSTESARQQTERTKTVASIGLGFEARLVSDYWHPLPGAVLEAEQIAALFDEKPIIDEAATEGAVRSALTTSRMIHIATHGAHEAFAPAFQFLQLFPTETSEGRLYAYELLDLDLRGVELVTLSACQTALGRFDAADNIRGLPASLLLSGVSTVIGTLWPVHDDVARSFFHCLYSALHDGVTRLGAFRMAQTHVRHSYPEHRKWAPFYYVGQWDREEVVG
jgi:hypothetical protein